MLSFFILLTLTIFYIKANKDKFESSFKQMLFDIQQNSIKNFEWTESEWQHYYNSQLERLPIFTKEYFYDCVEHALRDLHDNHSCFIKRHNCSNAQSDTLTGLFSVNVEEGIGVINLPTLITDVDQPDAILNEEWVIQVHNSIECVAPKVTNGWIINLTQNTGGNMYPMLAALSYFYNDSIIGGFYSMIKGDAQKVLVSFDGQAFTFDDQTLTYKMRFKTNQNTLPVIVLINKNTASSGEFVALALKRQKHVIIAGQESQGLATGNEVMQLPHALGNYMLTVAYYLDTDNQPLLENKVKASIILKEDQSLVNQAKQLILKNN